MTGDIAYKAIQDKRDELVKLASDIHANPEWAYHEYKAQKCTGALLEKEGFTVEYGAGGVNTAIKASWGSGHPVIGYLGEYDALPGLSQQVCTTPKPQEGHTWGHGCGHNLLGVSCVAAVLGAKAEMQAQGLPGTIVYYGCSAEEQATGKPYMARGGAFDGLDFAMAWHPDCVNLVNIGRFTALNSAKFHFTGKSAHAGGDPHNGRSALDAVELMNKGVNYLREHVTDDVRIHYIITNGGMAPNIVPEKASSFYFIRAFTREAVVDTYERICKIARGAALMTETSAEIEYLGGCYQTLSNMTLSNMLNDCFDEVPAEEFTEDERRQMREINAATPAVHASLCRMYGRPEGTEIFEGVLPMDPIDMFGSTDVGDVMNLVPTPALLLTSCYSLGTAPHTWQTTYWANSTVGFKGTFRAARILALGSLKLLTDPAMQKAATEEFRRARAGLTYQCPIPPDMPIPDIPVP